MNSLQESKEPLKDRTSPSPLRPLLKRQGHNFCAWVSRFATVRFSALMIEMALHDTTVDTGGEFIFAASGANGLLIAINESERVSYG